MTIPAKLGKSNIRIYQFINRNCIEQLNLHSNLQEYEL